MGGVTSPPPHWLERGVPSRQSSLIVQPTNGRMPAMTPEGAARQKTAGGTYVKQTGFNSASELGPYDRCISRGVVGSMMPVVYNNGNEIVQAPGLVAFRNEMIHEVRIIPLDPSTAQGRGARRASTLPASMKSYMGSSRGHFEGNTLVVRTTNLNGKTGMQGNGMMLIPSDSIVIEERFTPVSANVLQYEVTIDDPKTWTAPWKVSFPLKRDQDYQMFEYACHEGNYAMRNTLVRLASGRRKEVIVRLPTGRGRRASNGRRWLPARCRSRRASMRTRSSVLLFTVVVSRRDVGGGSSGAATASAAAVSRAAGHRNGPRRCSPCSRSRSHKFRSLHRPHLLHRRLCFDEHT